MTGIGLDGVTVITPTITVGPSVTLSGTGTGQTLTGNNSVPRTGAGSDAGNATFTFNSPIQYLSLAFGDDVPAFNNPNPQDISVGNISFTPVPEVNPAVGAAAACLLALGVMQHRRRRTIGVVTNSAR